MAILWLLLPFLFVFTFVFKLFFSLFSVFAILGEEKMLSVAFVFSAAMMASIILFVINSRIKSYHKILQIHERELHRSGIPNNDKNFKAYSTVSKYDVRRIYEEYGDDFSKIEKILKVEEIEFEDYNLIRKEKYYESIYLIWHLAKPYFIAGFVCFWIILLR